MSDYYELLAIPRTATTAEIRKAYARLAKERHPDRFTDPVEREQSQRFFMDITEAFNTLTNERSRREYDEALARPQPTDEAGRARDAYERGMKAIETHAYFESVELLRSAVYHQPQEALYRAALGMALARNREWVREAVHELEQAVQLDPDSAAYRAQLAEVLLGQGLKIRARKVAEGAIALDPTERRAQRVLQETAAEGSPGKP